VTNPIIPGTPQDRTGSAGLLRKAIADIRRRYAGLQAEVLATFDAIQVYSLNDAADRVAYGMTPEQMQAHSDALAATFDRWLIPSLSAKDPANVFWWSGYVEDAATLGAAQSVANLSNLSAAYGASRALETVIYSTPYKVRLAMAQIKSYDHWVGLAAQQKSDLSAIIGRAVVDGKNPRTVKTEIMDQLKVSKSRAEGYAQTDITDTLRQAKMAEAEDAREALNLNIVMLWTSALISTTRPTHAARNGKVYTTQEVKAFYAKDGNRYRCHCGLTQALLDKDGKLLLSDKAKARFKAETDAWEKAQADKQAS